MLQVSKRLIDAARQWPGQAGALVVNSRLYPPLSGKTALADQPRFPSIEQTDCSSEMYERGART